MKKFLILDGNSIVNRAFFGIRPLTTKTGLPTNAVYGFLTIIRKHIEALRPDYLACAFDVHAPTFRHKEYDAYKGTRKGMPDELRAQMPYAKRAAESLGFMVLERPGYEADDIIGTAARMADEMGDIETYILTGDRDSLQLVTERTTVILAKTKEDVHFTREHFISEYGITPEQFVDVKALMGDSSDNIPGVAGIGEKTALKLISSAGSLDSLYENVFAHTTSQSVIKKLTEGKESAYLSRMLAKIFLEVPLPEPAELFSHRGGNAEEFAALCHELEFIGMERRFTLEHCTEAEDTSNECECKDKLCVIEAKLSELKFDSAVPVYYNGEDAAAFSDGKVYLEKDISEDSLKAFIRANKIICHDYKNLLRTLHISGQDVCCEYDTMLAAYLINPGKSKYLLADLALEYTSNEPDSPAAYAYAISQIHTKTAEILEEYGMTSLMHEIEIPLSAVLADMEEIGFKIDPEGIDKYAKELLKMENALTQSIWMQAGREFNINSPKQLSEVLFEEIGLPAGKKTKTGYSTDADTLEFLRPYHTIISDILMYRQISKLRGTYGEPLINQADECGRIHTKLNQTGTATGRLASSDPNLQNIPIRQELGRELRKYFIAEDGYVLVDADYSQIELRILAELSGDENMRAAFINGVDIHTAVAAQVFGVDEDDVTSELRRRAKAVNFGIVYGIGDFSLAKDLGITRREAKEYIENYLSTYSGVDAYLKRTVEEAKEAGYTTTMFDRRRNIPEIKSSNKIQRGFGERVAMNSPIQGSAADVIKIAMIGVSRALREAGIDARLIMQVHDELIVEAKADCADLAAEILVREMENAVKTSVPLIADCGMGKTWYDAK